MINAAALVADLKKQVLVLEDDIRGRLEQLPVIKADWQARHRRQVDADRTASAWTSWRDDQITQAAVALARAGAISLAEAWRVRAD